jgi:hypothetical protein
MIPGTRTNREQAGVIAESVNSKIPRTPMLRGNGLGGGNDTVELVKLRPHFIVRCRFSHRQGTPRRESRIVEERFG